MIKKTVRAAAPATSESDQDLVAGAAALLQASGESTSVTLAAVERMNRGLGTDFALVPGWTSVTVTDQSAQNALPARIVPAAPTGISMRAVAVLMRTIDQLGDKAAGRADLVTTLGRAHAVRPANLWIFLIACATGAGSLAIIFGAQDATAVLLAAGSAALGGAIRRLLGRAHIGPIGQVFAAAFLAGIIGGLAVQADLSSSLRLIAVCPAMILVPGPHILNGALDLLALRIPLGFARLGYAALLLLSIGTGLAIALALFGTNLPTDPAGRTVPFWLDVVAAAIAAASYPVYFSMPYRLIVWPVIIGAVAHGLRWWAMSVWDMNIVVGAFLACLLVGIVLAPVAHRLHIPFAGIGFAAVVSLVPGVFVFRAIDALDSLPFGGADPQLLGGISDGTTAVLIIMAMAVGLAVPMHLYGQLQQQRSRRGARA
ncbi:threonine/serine exporter family protein [Herbiconiux sp. VKM Ac-1786]|uniref:threonine/serine ThrE exporter family protein n=1 Tax=Herbiconiux sp. VKM Ac-1786 TaxID=2783824 RepID=UPI001889D72F|nr:threonine/serine exporter family protein [Herbiconiux sp. VKM Ac-1786]MBF4572492.1 threonine/serine exporter family protein [Herbiconiux sp. VKM Ac-1786]